MAVDAAVADVERTRDINHGGFGEAKAAQHIFSGFENALRGQNDDFIHEEYPLRLAGWFWLAAEFRSLRLKVAGDLQVQPALDLGGKIKDFSGHGLGPSSSQKLAV